MLEALQYKDNAFVTLTYDNKALPHVGGLRGVWTGDEPLQTLVPKDLQDWLKRYRKILEPVRIRFYAVGEYGDESNRPHYHVAVFGGPCCLRGHTERDRSGAIRCCEVCRTVQSTWQLGGVFVGSLTQDSAQYIAGYVTKKMTAKDDYRLRGRHPEFARMSLRPGIGQSAMHEVASQLMRFNLDQSQPDVPSVLRHGSRLLPLGRYLRRNLRRMIGKDEKTPQAVLDAMAEEMRPLRVAAFDASTSFKGAILKRYEGERVRVYARHRMKRKRSTL